MNTLGRVFFAFLNINSQSRRSRARIFLLTDRSQEPDRYRPLYLLLLRGISRFTARPPFSRSKFITIHSVIDSLPQNDFSASLVHSLIQAFRLDWPISRNVPTQLQRRDPPDYREGTHPISGGPF